MKPFKKLTKKVRVLNNTNGYELLLVKPNEEETSHTPIGFFAIYVGDEKERFVVPTSYLSHPLLKILLEKACNQFGFEQSNGIRLPCTVATFKDVLHAVETNHGRFDMSNLFEEFV